MSSEGLFRSSGSSMVKLKRVLRIAAMVDQKGQFPWAMRYQWERCEAYGTTGADGGSI